MSPRSLIVLTFVIAIVIAIVFATLGALQADEFDLWLELGKAGVQLGVIVVGGAALTTALTALDASRKEKRRRIEEFRLGLVGDLLSAYNGLKDARRALRAAGLRAPSGALSAEQVAEFTKQMRSIAEIQLALERKRSEILTQPELVASAELLAGAISRLETYVQTIVTEWEQNGALVTTGVHATKLNALHELQRFLASAWVEGGFKQNASAPMQLLLEALRTS